MIYKVFDKNEIKLNKKEVLRYACASGAEEAFSSLLDSCIQEAKDALEPKLVYERVPVKVLSGAVHFPDFCVSSENLSKNMASCEETIIFAITLGFKTERLLSKNRLDMSRLVFINAALTAFAESLLNDFFFGLKEKLKEENKFLRPRFSPGYGDFSLEHQKDIFSSLNLTKTLGMTLTENLFMLPSKSVTGVSGISFKNENCLSEGCEICKKRDTCSFSRIK